VSFRDPSPGPIQEQIQDPVEDRIQVDTPEQIALEFPLAGIGSRFMAIALDTLIQFLLYLAGIFAMVGLSKLAPDLPVSLKWLPDSWLPALLILFLFCVYWGYFAIFEIFWHGKTPGKHMAGIRVIKDTGRALNVYETIGRNLMRAIDWLPLLYVVGIVTVMISRRNQRLGDFLVGSVVVHDKRNEELPPVWSPTTEKVAFDPQLGKLSPEELVLIETYLQRRLTLNFAARDAAAFQIASRITAKTGVQRPPDVSLDDFLENVAKQIRDGASFRSPS
jgi:uncharacterized RDD family membrane protein YckC